RHRRRTAGPGHQRPATGGPRAGARQPARLHPTPDRVEHGWCPWLSAPSSPPRTPTSRAANPLRIPAPWCRRGSCPSRSPPSPPHAHPPGGAGRGPVIRGDATNLSKLLPAVLHGQVALVVTSPPYGPTVHGLVRPTPGEGVAKSDNRYGTDKGNLAYQDLPGLLEGFTGILAGCATLLRPGGIVVVTVRPWRT